LTPQLKGRRLINGSYAPIPETTLADGAVVLPSQTLGLELRLLPVDPVNFSELLTRKLRLFDQQTGAKLLSYQETEQARLASEQIANEQRQRAEQESQRAEQAEDKLAALLERLKAQGIELEP
jgi:hypothetical protein